MSNIDWLSALGMLLAGSIVGFMFIYSMRRRDEKVDNELRDLEAKRDTLLAALRELADTGGPAAERTRLERQTAEVLKAIDAKTKMGKKRDKKGAPILEPQPVAVAAVPVSSTRATIKGFVWGVASFAVIGGIAWFVTQSAKPKDESGMNQASAMGSQPQSQTQASPQAVDPAVQNLEASVKKSPDDLGLRVQLAKAYLENENAMGTFEQTQYVLERSPNDPKALTYQAIVRIQMGQAEQARQMLENANKRDPDLLDASVALAWADTVTGKSEDAEKVIADATKRHPDEKERLSGLLTQMRERQKQAAANPPKEHPAVPPPPAGAADDAVSAPPAVTSNVPAIHITVNLAPTVKVPATAVLWIMARENGQASGPPLAVKRASASAGSIKIDLSASDSMMGQPLPQKVRIEARLDLDGNPMTHDPNDPTAFQDGVTAGANVVLNLK